MDHIEIEALERKLLIQLSRAVAISVRDLPCLLDADAVSIQLALKDLVQKGEIRFERQGAVLVIKGRLARGQASP